MKSFPKVGMHSLSALLCALTIVAVGVPAFADGDPHLNQSQPNRVELSTVPTLYIYGTGFDNTAHDRSLDMHWFVRRDDTPFQACTTMSNTHGPHDCALTGWSTNNQIVKLGSFFSARPGYVELQLWRGHGTPTVVHAIDAPSGWSNVLRIPVGPVAKSQGDGPNRNPTPRPSPSVGPISVFQPHTPAPAPTSTMHQATGLAPMMKASPTPSPVALTAKTACPSTDVYQTANGPALVVNGLPVVLPQGSEVHLVAKPMGAWAAIVRVGNPPGYVKASCLTSIM